MAGGNAGNLVANCSDEVLNQCSSRMHCPIDGHTDLPKTIISQLGRVDTLLVVQAVLAAVIVGIGAYGQRYCYHPITRFLFLGATTLFLPILSYIASAISVWPKYISPTEIEYGSNDASVTGFAATSMTAWVATCEKADHGVLFAVWASLVQIIMINTSTIVCVDDREGQCKGPPLELLAQGVWTCYLVVSLIQQQWWPVFVYYAVQIAPYALLSSKLGLKLYAFEKARRSVALGHNPGLVFVYMQQLQARDGNRRHVEPLASEGALLPPPLLIMGESEEKVERHPQGYAFKDLPSYVALVTIDRVWQLDSMHLTTAPWLKDLCLSFSLFKLLRCRFARYNLTNAGARNFFRSLLHKVGEDDRVFGVIVEELSFVHDYYYSSLPISYSSYCLPILDILLSLFTIAYCILFGVLLIKYLPDLEKHTQIWCTIWCIKGHILRHMSEIRLGEPYFDLVPLLLVLILVVTAEIRSMASYICSNWTKVTLICHYAKRNSSPQSLCMQKLVSILLSCRCKLMKHWNEEMGQCSVLVPHPRTTPKVLVNRLIRVPEHRRKVKVPAAVKASIMNAVRRSLISGHLSNAAQSLQRSSNQEVDESFLWACNGRGTSDIILTWHIATCILEVKHPAGRRQDQEQEGSALNPNCSDDEVTATHLSRYCAYLMIWCPELLPDNNAWSKGLYEAVKKDAEGALAVTGLARSSSSTPEDDDEYQKLVDLLGANSKHDVLKNGVKLGKQLVETINGEERAWKLLADFWSEMILYVAPSDNLKGHSEAIARGGELITLLWAMLFHVEIVSRPGEEDAAAAASSGPV